MNSFETSMRRLLLSIRGDKKKMLMNSNVAVLKTSLTMGSGVLMNMMIVPRTKIPDMPTAATVADLSETQFPLIR
jgi:hypothetical protein